MQTRLAEQKVNYSLGPYNKIKGDSQAIRITEGCPHNCPWCYEPTEMKVFGVPVIKKHKVLIFDMNILAKPEAEELIESLPNKIHGKSVYYEFVCGLDYRFMTEKITKIIYEGNFGRFRKDRKGNLTNWYKGIRLAWDLGMNQQYKIRDAINMLVKAGFKKNLITVFMIYNHSVTTLDENLRKMDLCKVWGVQIADCRYDNQIKTWIPISWSVEEMKLFRKKCRKHNQLVNFKIDPELSLT